VIGAVDAAFDWVELALTHAMGSVEHATGAGKHVANGYRKVQKDLKELTSITFEFEPGKHRRADDTRPVPAQEQRAALVRRFVS
jgi:hypothetical protein